MTDKKILQDCFNFLSQDLYRIERFDPKEKLRPKEHAINDIIRDIFSFNSEDALLYLEKYRDQTVTLIERIPTIIEPISINDKFSFEDEGSIIKGDHIKNELKENLIERLSYYKDELGMLIFRIGEDQKGLGSEKFSLAGFKLKLHLTNEEIASFFKALNEMKLISNTDGSPITNVQLATFITKNFSSDTTTNISQLNIKNKLSEAGYSQKIRDIFKKIPPTPKG